MNDNQMIHQQTKDVIESMHGMDSVTSTTVCGFLFQYLSSNTKCVIFSKVFYDTSVFGRVGLW